MNYDELAATRQIYVAAFGSWEVTVAAQQAGRWEDFWCMLGNRARRALRNAFRHSRGAARPPATADNPLSFPLSFDDLRGLTMGDIYGTVNCGPITFGEIKAAFARCGVALPEEAP